MTTLTPLFDISFKITSNTLCVMQPTQAISMHKKRKLQDITQFTMYQNNSHLKP